MLGIAKTRIMSKVGVKDISLSGLSNFKEKIILKDSYVIEMLKVWC